MAKTPRDPTKAALHLMKLAPGVQSADQMQDWIDREVRLARARGAAPVVRITTRSRPKRADEILAGGSLYWVWKGLFQARQIIRSIDSETGADGKSFCSIALSPDLIPVSASRKAAFQGWRYMAAQDAPADILMAGATAEAMHEIKSMPLEMRAALAQLGVL